MFKLPAIVALNLLSAAFNFAIAAYFDFAVNLMVGFFSLFVCIAVVALWPDA